ncbi:putative RING-H2 finger protein ATL69, partial [Mucuna pruriens]
MFPAAPPSAAVATTGVGLGYGIAIAVSILVLISTIMLASYACVRIKANGRRDTYYDDRQQNYVRETPGPVAVVLGLEKPTIEAYPKMVIGESRRLPKPNEGPCAICLCEYLPNETIRCVPDCHHCFHAHCVDEWLRMSATCPLCRNSPAPSPAATPLSELVPLAFHARLWDSCIQFECHTLEISLEIS